MNRFIPKITHSVKFYTLWDVREFATIVAILPPEQRRTIVGGHTHMELIGVVGRTNVENVVHDDASVLQL
jgi:hypothetical protein